MPQAPARGVRGRSAWAWRSDRPVLDYRERAVFTSAAASSMPGRQEGSRRIFRDTEQERVDKLRGSMPRGACAMPTTPYARSVRSVAPGWRPRPRGPHHRRRQDPLGSLNGVRHGLSRGFRGQAPFFPPDTKKKTITRARQRQRPKALPLSIASRTSR